MAEERGSAESLPPWATAEKAPVLTLKAMRNFFKMVSQREVRAAKLCVHGVALCKCDICRIATYNDINSRLST